MLRPAYLAGALTMMALVLAFPVRMMAAVPPAQEILAHAEDDC